MRFAGFITAVAAVAVCLPTSADAQRTWRQIHSDATVTVALDTARVTRGPNRTYTVLLRWNYAAPRTAENRRQYTRMVQQVQVMCGDAVRVKRFAFTLYSATGVLVEEARPLSSSEVRNMDWEVPPPRSEGARVYPRLCTTLTQRTRRSA